MSGTKDLAKNRAARIPIVMVESHDEQRVLEKVPFGATSTRSLKTA